MNSVTPQEYLQRTGQSYQELADTIGYPYDSVKRWFQRGRGRREPQPVVGRFLALQLELMELKNGRSHDNSIA
jgi:hypothetical protein